jgi:hypothetical protein
VAKHALANKSLRAKLEKNQLSPDAAEAIRKAFLAWEEASADFSEAVLSFAPPRK